MFLNHNSDLVLASRDAGTLELSEDEVGLKATARFIDTTVGLDTAKNVRAGQVFVNGYGAGGGIELPFGGFKKSGHGREKGFEALYDMSATKMIVFNHG